MPRTSNKLDINNASASVDASLVLNNLFISRLSVCNVTLYILFLIYNCKYFVSSSNRYIYNLSIIAC